MKFKKTDILAVLVLAATLIQLIIIYPSLPEKVVTNWGFDGQVSYGGKGTVWVLYGLNVFMMIMFFIIPKIDPKGKSYQKIDGFYTSFRLVMVIFISAMLEIVILSANNPYRFNVGKIVMISVSLLFIFIGNYLPKCKQNYTMGIKNMWTLADERVWRDTHRIGGVVFVLSGVVSAVLGFILPENIYSMVFFAIVFVPLIITFIYSYFSYKKYNLQ